MRTLLGDQQRISMRTVVKAALDIEPSLELVARDCVGDFREEVFDPRFDRALHLVTPGVRIVEGHLLVVARSDCFRLCVYQILNRPITPLSSQMKKKF